MHFHILKFNNYYGIGNSQNMFRITFFKQNFAETNVHFIWRAGKKWKKFFQLTMLQGRKVGV